MPSSQNHAPASSAAATDDSYANRDRRKFSISVNRALESINSEDAGDTITGLLNACQRIHPNYGKEAKGTLYPKRFGNLGFSENFKACIDDSTQRQIPKRRGNEWAEIVLSIVTPPDKTPSIRAEVPVVNTRMFVITAVLDQFLQIAKSITRKKPFAEFCYQLANQFDEELQDEEKINYEECLSQKGKDCTLS